MGRGRAVRDEGTDLLEDVVEESVVGVVVHGEGGAGVGRRTVGTGLEGAYSWEEASQAQSGRSGGRGATPRFAFL